MPDSVFTGRDVPDGFLPASLPFDARARIGLSDRCYADDGEGREAADDEALHGFSSIASANVMATEERTTEVVAKKATTNDPANASFFFM